MAAREDPKDLDRFLSQVDEIESIVKALNSSDEQEVKSAMVSADKLMKKAEAEKGKEEDDEDGYKTTTGYSKSQVNKYKPGVGEAQPTHASQSPQQEVTSQEAFMKMMEKDAEERAERRRKRWREADEIKLRGNEEFKKGDYQAALDLYNQAIGIVRDNTALYTNRAQTHIKLGMFDKALVDCEWAFKVDDKCIKAYIHEGRAHLGLKDFDKARNSYNTALQLDPTKEPVIKNYLAEVDRVQQAESQEQNAKQLFESGETHARGIVELLEKVRRVNQLPLFYSGGFRIIADLLRNTDQKTLFRTNGGLKLCEEHQTLARCLQASPKSLSKEELEMLTSAMEMFTVACTDNETNQEQFFANENIADHMLLFLEAKMKGYGRALKYALIDFLFTVSGTEFGRTLIITKFDTPRLLTDLFALMRVNSSTGVKSGNLLSNLCLEKKLRSHLREKLEEKVLPAFEALLRDESASCLVITNSISTMTNLVNDKAVRLKVAKHRETWEACLQLLTKHGATLEDSGSAELVLQTLGLLMNISVEVTPSLKDLGTSTAKICLPLWERRGQHPGIAERSLGVLGHVLPHSAESVEWVCENGGPAVFTEAIKTEDERLEKSSVRCLSACTQTNEKARSYVVDNKGLGALMRLLKSEDELTVGNAALCLSHCTQVPKVCLALAKTDVIKELLVLARDGRRPQVQQNCAILIAKLAQGHSKHLERLRELHGIEILHGCMKYIK